MKHISVLLAVASVAFAAPSDNDTKIIPKKGSFQEAVHKVFSHNQSTINMTCLKEAVAEVGSKTDGVAFLEYLRGTDPGVGGIIAERIFSSVNSFVFGEGMNLEQIVGTAIEVIEEPRRYDISLMKRRIKDFSNFSQIFTKCFNNDLLLNYLVHSVSENDIVSLLLHIIQSDEDYLSIRSYDKVHKIENMVQERVRNRVLKLVTLLESFVGVEEKP